MAACKRNPKWKPRTAPTRYSKALRGDMVVTLIVD